MRWAAEVAYLGSAFSGWQRQAGSSTVQGALEEALTRLNGVPSVVEGAGRTDGGVHARGQVVSFDTARRWEPSRLRLALEGNLPQTLRVLRIAPVDGAFRARHDAQYREYVYFLWTETCCYPHLAPYVWHNRTWQDLEPLRACCRLLPGTHDFRAFCRAADCPDESRRTLYAVTLLRRGPMVRLRIRGRGFLTNMVRIIVGSLDAVARGKRDPSWFASLLGGKGREESGRTAPPQGLFLWKVGYVPSPWRETSEENMRATGVEE